MNDNLIQNAGTKETTTPIWRKCGCHSCGLQKLFGPEDWLCEFHETAPAHQWSQVSERIKRWMPLLQIAHYLQREPMFDEQRLTQRLIELKVPSLAPRRDLDGFNRDGKPIKRLEAGSEVARRILNFVKTRVIQEDSVNEEQQNLRADELKKLAAKLRM